MGKYNAALLELVSRRKHTSFVVIEQYRSTPIFPVAMPNSCLRVAVILPCHLTGLEKLGIEFGKVWFFIVLPVSSGAELNFGE